MAWAFGRTDRSDEMLFAILFSALVRVAERVFLGVFNAHGFSALLMECEQKGLLERKLLLLKEWEGSAGMYVPQLYNTASLERSAAMILVNMVPIQLGPSALWAACPIHKTCSQHWRGNQHGSGERRCV